MRVVGHCDVRGDELGRGGGLVGDGGQDGQLVDLELHFLGGDWMVLRVVG